MSIHGASILETGPAEVSHTAGAASVSTVRPAMNQSLASAITRSFAVILALALASTEPPLVLLAAPSLAPALREQLRSLTSDYESE